MGAIAILVFRRGLAMLVIIINGSRYLRLFLSLVLYHHSSSHGQLCCYHHSLNDGI